MNKKIVEAKWCPYCGKKELFPIDNPNEGDVMYLVSDFDGDSEFFSDGEYSQCKSCEKEVFLLTSDDENDYNSFFRSLEDDPDILMKLMKQRDQAADVLKKFEDSNEI